MTAVLTTIGWVLLWILVGIFGLLALIALLLCVPVHLLAHYGDETCLRLRYGLIPITILPTKPKKEKKTKQPKKPEKPTQVKEEKPKTPLKETLAQYGIPDHIPETMGELLKALAEVGKTLDGFRRSLTIRLLRVEVVCGGSDAAQAAINYGRAWPIVTGIEQTMSRLFRLKKFEGTAVPDFQGGKQIWRGDVHLRVMPIRLAAVVVHRGLKIFGGYRRIKKKNKKRMKQKGVTNHEQSGS